MVGWEDSGGGVGGDEGCECGFAGGAFLPEFAGGGGGGCGVCLRWGVMGVFVDEDVAGSLEIVVCCPCCCVEFLCQAVFVF